MINLAGKGREYIINCEAKRVKNLILKLPKAIADVSAQGQRSLIVGLSDEDKVISLLFFPYVVRLSEGTKKVWDYCVNQGLHPRFKRTLIYLDPVGECHQWGYVLEISW